MKKIFIILLLLPCFASAQVHRWNGEALTSSTVGLDQVNNTSDANKPVSTATTTALGAKLDSTSSPITGHYTATGTATTVFTVTIGRTMANNTYKVGAPVGKNVLSGVIYWIDNQTTTTFDAHTVALTGAVAFDWTVYR